MTEVEKNNLSNAKIQTLLDAVRKNPTKKDDDIQADEHKWGGANYFNKAQLETLEKFANEVSYQCAVKFSELYNSKFDVETVSVAQHYAETLFNSENVTDCYYMGFGPDLERPFGMIEIPIKSALIWTRQILGEDTAAEDVEIKLSKLEESLLLDITAGLIKSLSTAYNLHDLYPINKIKFNNIAFEMEESAEIYKIEFAASKQDSQDKNDASFLILCNQLDQVAGKIPQDNNVSSQNNSAAVRGHLGKIDVGVKVKLGQTKFNLGQIMDLKSGDVLVLDKNVHSPAEVIVNGKTVFGGNLAKSENNCAIKITECYNVN